MLVDLVIQSYGPARRVALVPDLPCPIRKPQRSARLALIPIHISARKCTAARHGLVPGIAAAKIELQPRRHQIGQVDAHLPEHGHIPVLVEGSRVGRSEEHTSELQSLMRISYAVFC